ncbi:hypothetical protein QQ045_023942 [Rhodiola kirilowii]
MASIIFLLLLIISYILPLSTPSPTNDDASALTAFRLQTDTHAALLSNWTGADSCATAQPWLGVHCLNSRVSILSLPFLSLRGPIDALSSLDQLRILDLRHNRLNGSISAITALSNLKIVYLAGNDLSGQIPEAISSLHRMLRFDLSDNNLRGTIPSFFNLTKLLTLSLQNNVLSGRVPNAFPPQLLDLNLSNNELDGQLPDNLLKRYGESSFAGNKDLCGASPFPACSLRGPAPASSGFIQQSNSLKPTRRKLGLSTGAIVAIVLANCVALLVIISFLIAYFCAGSTSRIGSEIAKQRRSGSSYGGSEKKVYNESDETSATDRSKLVFYDRKKEFELEDLLRASAEMLGKGSLGTVYRAVLDDGCTVMAVKRLKDANPCGKKEFEHYMDLIGKMKHPNIVKLRAYYFAKEEKLLVYDYLPNGSLHTLLHANRGQGRIPLDWTTRISLVLGAARGLAKIHEKHSVSKIPHGNVKSSNVLLDKNGVACISDFGLSLLLNPVHATARLGGYKAPEQTQVKKLSQKSDVYSFGVMLLEVLTGRAPSQYPCPEEDDDDAIELPKWVRSVVRDEWTAEVFDQELLRYKNIEEELVTMLQVALACVVVQPEKRPTMTQVVKMLEEIRVEQSPPLGDDYDESRDSTEDGLPNF